VLATFDLRNATAAAQGAVEPAARVSDHGSSIVAFADPVSVMRVTGNVLYADLLHALIARLAELLSEPLPPDL
jgi:hypothetical protein